MKPHHVLLNFADLIYTRLDLPQVPQVDMDAVVRWMQSKNRSVMMSKKLHDDESGNKYPWRAVHAYVDGRWDVEFAEMFPELIEYLKNFPTSMWRWVCVVGQLQDSEVFLHTDPDFGVGWRVYLSHGGPKLYFQKFKERHEERPGTWATGGPQGMAELCDQEKLYVDDCGAYPWAITSIRAAHGVSPNPSALGARVTLLLAPEPEAVDWPAVRALLARSTQLYKDTAIWY